MKRKNSRKANRANVWDPKKDSTFKELAAILSTTGYSVRREDLKQGHGWRVVSGSCRLEEQRLIFVDRKMPQDEQISFLVQNMITLGVKPQDEQLANMPEKIREAFAATPAIAA